MTQTLWPAWLRLQSAFSSAPREAEGPPAEWLLRRKDNHYLDDIGLTRAELCKLLGRWQS